MAIITKIREKAMVAVVVVSIAMAAFILGGDLFMGRSMLYDALFGPSDAVGEIDGKEIGMEEFNKVVNEIRASVVAYTGQEPQDMELERIRQQAWRTLMHKYAYSSEFSDLGIAVSEKEMEDLLSGQNISPAMSSFFQKDGQVDREALKNFLDNYNANPRTEALYKLLTYSMKEDRMFEKYSNMLSLTNYATKAEAQREYTEQNTQVSMEFLYVPYSSVPDSTIKLDDSALQSFYKANEKKYERDANRELEYVLFPLTPTAEDEKAISDELAQEMEAFKASTNDSSFVDAKSEGDQNFLDARLGDLPPSLKMDKIEKGAVYGPVKDGKSFKLYKIMSTTPDSVAWASASHILFKEEDQAKAQEVLKELQGGADFAAKAMEHSTDNSNKGRGGDLGWFDEKTMVESFSKAVFGAKSEGIVPSLVKTQFGYHIIKVTGVPTKQRVQLAILEKAIVPSKETENAVYRKVGEFSKYKTREELKKACEDAKILLLQANNVSKTGTNINNLSGPSIRQVVRWAYNDKTEVGDVSEPFEIDDQYMIAVLNKKREKGIAPLEDVREEVRVEAIKLEQAKVIVGKLGNVTDLAQAAQTYGPAAVAAHADDTPLNSMSINRIGFAPKTMGKVASMQANQVSAPIADENGIVVVKLENVKPATETADFTAYRTRIQERRAGTVYMQMQRALEVGKKINDMRYKYF